MLRAGVNGLAHGGGANRVIITQTGTPTVISGTQSTFNFNAQSIGADIVGRLAGVAIYSQAGAGTAISDVTFDGMSADNVIQVFNNDNGFANLTAFAWRGGVSGATSDIAVILNNDKNILGVCPYSILGARNADAFASDTDDGTATQSLSVPFFVRGGALAVAGNRNDPRRTYDWTGVIEDIDFAVNANNTLSVGHLDSMVLGTPLAITATPNATPDAHGSVAVSFWP